MRPFMLVVVMTIFAAILFGAALTLNAAVTKFQAATQGFAIPHATSISWHSHGGHYRPR